MAESYYIRRPINLEKCEYGQTYFTTNMGANSPSSAYNFKTPNSVISILNQKNSGKIIRIKNIKIINNDEATTGSGVNYAILPLSLISSAVGGIEILPTKLNSAASNVYAGIQARVGGQSVKTTVIRNLGGPHAIQNWPGTDGYNYFQDKAGPLSNGRGLYSFKSTDTTPIILRNGEGLALSSLSSPLNFSLNVMVLISDADGGGFGEALYSFDTNLYKNFDTFSIYNGESGTAIKILGIDINFKAIISASNTSITSSTAICGVYSVCKILGTQINTGDIVTPIPLDSTNTLGSTDIEIKEFAKTQFINETVGAKYLPAIQRISGKYNSDRLIGVNFHRVRSISQIRSNKFTEIILTEGEGIGLFAEILPMGGINEAIIEYTVENEVVTPGTCTPSASVYIG